VTVNPRLRTAWDYPKCFIKKSITSAFAPGATSFVKTERFFCVESGVQRAEGSNSAVAASPTFISQTSV
jgi:hypothetical protein